MGHFYAKDGTPTYFVVGSNGIKRDTTLKDAKKLKLVPSVTTITGQLAKPFLDRWKQNQLLDVVMDQDSLTSILNLGDNWKDKLLELTNKRTSKYAERGTEIHDAIEKALLGQKYPPKDVQYIEPVVNLLYSLFEPDLCEYHVEESFCHKAGFGGKIDLYIKTSEGKVLIDFKTKQGKDLSYKSIYKDYGMQLAAYAQNFDDVYTYMNILISATDPGIIYVHDWSDEDIRKCTKMFY